MIISLLAIELVADAAFCVAAPEVAQAIDRPVAADPRDRSVIVPATSLIGGLRDHARRRGVDETYFGSVMGAATLTPSPVRALGVRVRLDGTPIRQETLELREQTAIDRTRASAANHTFRTSQAVPAGATLTLYLRIDTAETSGLIDLITSWQPHIGSSRTAGLGVAHLTNVRHGTLDLDVPADLTTFLSRHGPDLVDHVATTSAAVVAASGSVVRRWTFRTTDGLRTRGEHEGNTTKALTRNGRYPLDGSSLKGVFRSRCEFIVNSIAAALSTEPRAALIDELFGTVARRGTLAFGEVELRTVTVNQRPHVGIDRVTGGAHDEIFFTDEVLNAEFDVEIRNVGPTPIPEVGLALLDAVVADIHDGYVGLGGATARGHGTVRLIGDPPTPNLAPFADLLTVEPAQEQV